MPSLGSACTLPTHMKSVFAELKLAHLVLAALLAATLWFSSAREAHGLCFRLLLHWKGDTAVHGQQPGCVIYTVPNVQFTPERIQELRAHSKDSLDAYALATSTGNYAGLELPMVDATWKNHPLLEWVAFRLVWISTEQHSTNQPEQVRKLYSATAESARQAIHLAQSVNVTNGALWLAEACLEFDAGHDAVALAVLPAAASNQIWSASSAATFSYISDQFHKAGLSELDAVIQANSVGIEFMPYTLQLACSRIFDRLMTVSIRNGDDAEFLRILEMSTALRRAEWSDENIQIYNSISLRRTFTDDFDNAIALKLGRDLLPKEDDQNYRRRREISRQNFDDFLNQLPDRRLAAIYLTQDERAHYEKRLRSKVMENWWHWRWFLCLALADVSGMGAPLLLTLMVVACGLELVVWRFRQSHMGFKEAMRQPKFLAGLFVGVLGLALLISNFTVSLGMNSPVGLQSSDFPPPSHPDLTDFLVFCFISMLAVVVAFFWGDKIRVDIKYKRGQLTMLAIGGYLISILLMACCRYGLVEFLAAQYQ